MRILDSAYDIYESNINEYQTAADDTQSIEYGNNIENISFINPSKTGLKDIIEHENKHAIYNGRGIVALFRAVIMQALIDISSGSKRTEDKVAKVDAIRWINQDNEDFKLVCLLADLSPEWVINKCKVNNIIDAEDIFLKRRQEAEMRNRVLKY